MSASKTQNMNQMNQDLKISTNLTEVQNLDPCPSGLRDFERMLAVLGKRDNQENNNNRDHENILFSTCLQHIDLEDCFWFLCEIEDQLSKSQQDDLHLLACDYAESCLHLFEDKYPDDKRPRAAIEAKRAWVRGECTDDELGEARDAAYAAARDSRDAMAARAARDAGEAAWAAWDAGADAWAASWAARDAARDAEQKDRLMQVIKKWEQRQI